MTLVRLPPRTPVVALTDEQRAELEPVPRQVSATVREALARLRKPASVERTVVPRLEVHVVRVRSRRR